MSSSSITRPPYFTDNLRVENKIDYEEIKRATNVRDNFERNQGNYPGELQCAYLLSQECAIQREQECILNPRVVGSEGQQGVVLRAASGPGELRLGFGRLARKILGGDLTPRRLRSSFHRSGHFESCQRTNLW